MFIILTFKFWEIGVILPYPLKVDGKIISDNKQIAKVLNDYFLSVYTRENLDNVPNCPAYEGIKLENVTFTSTKIEKKIRYKGLMSFLKKGACVFASLNISHQNRF